MLKTNRLTHFSPFRKNLLLILSLTLVFLLSGCQNEETGKPLHIGDQAPDFTLTDMNGVKLHLREWAGSPVILRFWNTDCKYCRADTPTFNDYFKRYSTQGLKVVYINSGASHQDVTTFIKELEIPFFVAMDQNGSVAARYKVKAVPQTIFIDPDQKIISAILGGVGKAELDELVGKYFH